MSCSFLIAMALDASTCVILVNVSNKRRPLCGYSNYLISHRVETQVIGSTLDILRTS